jgi:excinuclease ABC subunit A
MKHSKAGMTDSEVPRQAIEVVCARTHNLKGVSCRIPHGKVTVVTGPSGAGKSSLAFDTVYAEAQRRFVESMSTYARQFLEQMERPPVEALHNILPAVALEARNSVKNARSTVGTLTEVWDVLRLLYTHLGEVGCPQGHGLLNRHTSAQAADVIAAGSGGQNVLLLAHLPRPPREANIKLRELVRQGYGRRLEDGEVVRMTPSQRWLKVLDPLPLVIGRFKAGGEASARLVSAVEEAYQLTGGRLQTVDLDGKASAIHFGRALTCGVCGVVGRRPSPALFSFNSPLGACPACEGFGRVAGIDRRRVIPDPSLSLREGPIAVWNSPGYQNLYDELFFACREEGISLSTPYEDLPEAIQEWLWSGCGSFTNLNKFFAWAERRKYKVHMRVLLARYRAYNRCPSCAGRRLRPEALGVRIRGENLSDLGARSVEQLRHWFAAQRFDPQERARAGHLLDQLQERLDTLHRVGLDYLSLDRQARTLSGGEAQRIQLTAALGSGLTSTLYVLDEPTIGLHPSDSRRLLDLLHDLARRGNTVLVVEHDPTLIRGADHIIDLGPRAGEHGGEVMAEGTLGQVLAKEDSLTSLYLKAEERRSSSRKRPESVYGALVSDSPRFAIRGAAAHNLCGFDVEIPLNALVAVTGVSGSGKSTLIENVLYGTYQRSRGKVDVEPGDCVSLGGLEDLDDITLVDQRPLGRSTRSNPVTYLKAYDEIRKLFAATPAARERGIAAGHFSFNLDRGRCQECSGTGVQEVDMHFMAAVTVVCDACQGHRFQAEVLAVICRGRNIAETLDLTVLEAMEIFGDRTKLCRLLEHLLDVGLGYLRLGQPTATLSGGEAQRLKFASFLSRPRGELRLFLFDEQTTCLHLADIDVLYETFRRLISRGQGVVVVEHSLELIARADWIVDLGPGGGVHGGGLLFSGPTDEFLDRASSPTAEELRQHLKWRRKKPRKVADC